MHVLFKSGTNKVALSRQILGMSGDGRFRGTTPNIVAAGKICQFVVVSILPVVEMARRHLAKAFS